MIIDPTKKTKLEPLSKEALDEIAKLNDQITDKSGEWMYLEDTGLVWKPTIGDLMGGKLSDNVKPPAAPSKLLQELVEFGKGVDFDNLPDNAVVLIKLNTDNPMRFDALQRGIVKSVLDPRFEKLKQKRICILFVQSGEDISVMTEEEMGQAGWEKKEKSRIITL